MEITAVFTHIAAAAYVSILRVKKHEMPTVFWGIMIIGVVVAIVLTTALSGLVNPFTIPEIYW